ncbi:hypothetical protein NliqN6_0280 [Naganishia liquefaciens]|uniref:EXPERA domain-containing protein n=1 Tax=Naganishia liquefaciens TaxID=104408 RepID=A0A8H3TMR0_9TREE|nr:hypothetical protein NliqN6_0280 [Naganishia liquefaciens]
MAVTRIPLSQRTLDRIYFCFFVSHIPTTLLVDGVAIYPPRFVPQFLKDFISWYISFSGDPLIGGLASGARDFYWFRSFIFLEVFFQLPVFAIAAYCLYYNKRWVYPLLIVYGASTSTTLLPCVYHLLSPQIPAPAPLPGSSKSFSFTSLFDDIPPRSGELSNLQLLILLGSYIPFFLFPFAITVDMCRRVSRALVRQEKSEAQAKSR